MPTSAESTVELTRHPYADDAWHVEIRVVGSGYRVEQEFYAHAAELRDLAKRLQAFPTSRADEVRFEAGSKAPGWAHWVFLRVFLVDSAGHAGMTFDVESNGDVLRARSARPTIGCDVGSVNELGIALQRWVENPESPIIARLYAS